MNHTMYNNIFAKVLKDNYLMNSLRDVINFQLEKDYDEQLRYY